jgi:hypothetical protein
MNVSTSDGPSRGALLALWSCMDSACQRRRVSKKTETFYAVSQAYVAEILFALFSSGASSKTGGHHNRTLSSPF